MTRLLIGSLIGALAMFVLGFIFYGPLIGLGFAQAPIETQIAVQTALKSLPGTGVYLIPFGNTPAEIAAYQQGPIAQIYYTARGYPIPHVPTLVGGYVQMAVSVFLVGLLLWGVRDQVRDFASRARIVIGVAAIGSVYLNLSGPVWYHAPWHNALYVAAVNFLILMVGGLILARWFVRSPLAGV